MSPAHLARVTARRESTLEKSSANGDHHKKMRFCIAMIQLVYEVVDFEGNTLLHHTWTTGHTVKKAMRRWTRKYPEAAAALVQQTIVTEGDPNQPYYPPHSFGERVEVKDEALAHVADGLK